MGNTLLAPDYSMYNNKRFLKKMGGVTREKLHIQGNVKRNVYSVSSINFETHLSYVDVDFYITSNKIIFLQNNQDTDYSPISQCQLKSFVLVNPFDVTDVEAGPITIELTNQTPNAKSFDITDSGNQLFVLYGEGPLYQTKDESDTATGLDAWSTRFNDVDYVQGFNLTAYDISTLVINDDNKNIILNECKMK